MAMYLHRVGAESPPARRVWRPRDCALYALGVGAGFDDLAFTTESSAGEQKVFPTFVLAGVMSAESESWPDPGFETGSYALSQLVLGQQALVLHDAVKPSGDVTSRTRVAGIYDKGSGALVLLEIHATDNTTGRALFTATTGLFVMGEGGFGGERGPSGATAAPPERVPDHRVSWRTLATQTLLWRHAGNDANPVHVDPAFARAAGFRGPILAGLNTMGFADRALAQTVVGSHPERMRSIEGRFAAPGYNADVLTTEIWAGDDVGTDEHGDTVALYRVVSQAGDVLVDRGRATFA
jgi:acyl dehydratase